MAAPLPDRQRLRRPSVEQERRSQPTGGVALLGADLERALQRFSRRRELAGEKLRGPQGTPGPRVERIELGGLAKQRDGLRQFSQRPRQLRGRAQRLHVLGPQLDCAIEIAPHPVPVPQDAEADQAARQVPVGQIRTEHDRLLGRGQRPLLPVMDGGDRLRFLSVPEAREREPRPGRRIAGIERHRFFIRLHRVAERIDVVEMEEPLAEQVRVVGLGVLRAPALRARRRQ